MPGSNRGGRGGTAGSWSAPGLGVADRQRPSGPRRHGAVQGLQGVVGLLGGGVGGTGTDPRQGRHAWGRETSWMGGCPECHTESVG